MFVNMAVSSVAHYLGSKPFVNLTIDEYLWGYEDPLVQLANNVVPNWIDFPRFGILERVSYLSAQLSSVSNNSVSNCEPALSSQDLFENFINSVQLLL